MNKTRRCAGRLRASNRLKSKNKFTIKRFLFSTNPELSLQRFSGRFDPIHGYINGQQKFPKVSRHWGQQAERIVTRHISDEIKDRRRQPTHFIINTNTTHSLPTHVTLQCQTSQERLTPTHLLILIRWKKKACTSSNIPTFIY